MRSLYVVDRPLVEGDLHVGRETRFRRLKELVDTRERLLILCGGRRIGKTSFLNHLSDYLGERYVCFRIDWPSLTEADANAAQPTAKVGARSRALRRSAGVGPLSRLLLGMSRAMSQPAADSDAFNDDPSAYASDYVRSLFPTDGDRIYLLCVDSVPLDELVSDNAWGQAVETLRALLGETGSLGIVLAVTGYPIDLEGSAILQDAQKVVLGPLGEEETEQLLMGPARGHVAYDYESMRRIHRLAGGEPYLIQLLGKMVFERRSSAGWVDLATLDQVAPEAIAVGEGHFAEIWDRVGQAGQVVLCAMAEMIGHHGVGSAEDVTRHLSKLRVPMPMSEVEEALDGLARRGVLDRLGGGTFRIRSALFRQWLQQSRTVLEVAARSSQYRRRRLRRKLALRNKRVDWVAWILWLAAGLLVICIAIVWRSRERSVVWTVEPTPVPTRAEADALVPPRALPSPQKGVAPGHIAYMLKENPEDSWEIYSMRSDGSDPVRLTDNEANDTSPQWAPDGRHVAFVSDRDGNREVYVMRADGNEQINLTVHPSEDWTPTWSPDGQRIAFATFRDGNWEIYLMEVDGTNPVPLTRNDAADYSPAWSPDGARLAFVSNRDGDLEIYVMNADGSDQVRFTNDAATDQAPVWSPDGEQIAWSSYRDDNMEVYLARVDGLEVRSASRDAYADDHGPTWSPWGGRLAFFTNRDQGWDIHTIDLQTGERVNLTMSPALEQGPHWGP